MSTPKEAPYKLLQRYCERRCRQVRLLFVAGFGAKMRMRMANVAKLGKGAQARRVETEKGTRYVRWTEPSGRKGAKGRR